MANKNRKPDTALDPYTTPKAIFSYHWLTQERIRTGPYLYTHNESEAIAHKQATYTAEFHAILTNGAIGRTLIERPVTHETDEEEPDWHTTIWAFL